jgi:hypothetical protein
MLSVSLGEFDLLREQYADLNLSENMADYNFIDISAEQLSAASLKNAVATAGQTAQNDLIVVRNNGDTIIDFGAETWNIDIDSALYGNAVIVSLGSGILTLQSSAETGVVNVAKGNVALGGIVLSGVENTHSEAPSGFNQLQSATGASVQTSHVVKVTELSNRPGNFSLFPPGENEKSGLDGMLTTGGSQIGSKSYAVEISTNDGGWIYLAGLSESDKNAVLSGTMNVLKVSPYDADKTYKGDTLQCWAGATANMLAYTGWAQSLGFQTEDDIFKYFRENFTDEGGNSYFANEWFITGNYEPLGEANWSQPSSGGGLYGNTVNYSDIAGAVRFTGPAHTIEGDTIDDAVDKLKEGCAISLTIQWPWGGAHAITMWGAIYDASGKCVGLLVTDSDDGKGGVNAPNQLQRLDIQNWADSVRFPGGGYNDSGPAYSVYSPSTGYGYMTAYSYLANCDGTLKPDLSPAKYFANGTKQIIVTDHEIWNGQSSGPFIKTTSTSTLYAREPLYASFALRNDGVIASVAPTVTLTLSGGNLASPNIQTFTLETGTSGNILTQNIVWCSLDYELGELAAGTYTLTVMLDSNYAITEANENNNTFSLTFTVVDRPAVAPKVTVAATTFTSVKLTWDPSLTPVNTDYTVKATGVNENQITYLYDSGTGNKIGAVITGLVPNKKYAFTITAWSGSKTAAATATVTTSAEVKVTAKGGLTSMVLSWNPVPQVEYEVEVWQTVNGKLTLVGSSSDTSGKISVDISNNNSATITNLNVATAYTFSVKSVGTDVAGGTEITPGGKIAASTTNYTKVGGLKKVNTTISTVTLQWNAGLPETDHYEVYWMVGKSWVKVSNTNDVEFSGDKLSATISGLDPGKKYTFVVRAVTADNQESKDASISITTAKYAAVTAIKKGVSTLTTATFSWTDVNASDYYIITYKVGSKTETVRVETKFVTIEGLDPGKTYKFEVKAYKDFGGLKSGEQKFAVSAVAKVSIATQKYVAVTMKKVFVGLTEITLQWTDPKASETTYYVLSYKDAHGQSISKTVSGTDPITLQDFLPGKTFKFEVRSYCTTTVNGVTKTVSSAVGKLSVSTPKYTAVSGMSGIPSSSNDSITLHWTDPKASETTHYEIVYYPGNDKNNPITLSVGSLSEITIENLVPGTKYTFVMYAVVKKGDLVITKSAKSSTVTMQL